jgi:hybrid cluster-associated redox disulfide protein
MTSQRSPTVNETTTAPPITPNTPIFRVIEDHPQTVAVFNALNMACPGCFISPFHTVTDSAREYDLSPERLLQRLRDCASPNGSRR